MLGEAPHGTQAKPGKAIRAEILVSLWFRSRVDIAKPYTPMRARALTSSEAHATERTRGTMDRMEWHDGGSSSRSDPTLRSAPDGGCIPDDAGRPPDLDLREINYGRWNASPVASVSEGGQGSQDVIVKDSQDEGLGPCLAEWQDPRHYADGKSSGHDSSKASAEKGKGRHSVWAPPLQDPSDHEHHSGQQNLENPDTDILSTLNWIGKRSRTTVTTRVRRSSGVESGGISVAQQLQGLIGIGADNASPFLSGVERDELSLGPGRIPLAQKLQELSRKPAEESIAAWQPDSPGQGYHTGSPPSTENCGLAVEDDIIGSFNSQDDVERKGPEISGSTAVPALPNALLWEQFRGELECEPVDTNLPHPSMPKSRHLMSGFSARLQNVLKNLRSQQMRFEKALASGNLLHESSECLVVSVLQKALEAQFTTCQCEVLQSPQGWSNGETIEIAGEGDGHSPHKKVEVIFSSKISPELNLEVGAVVRIHPPWHEIHGVGKSGMVILSTFFCENASGYISY